VRSSEERVTKHRREKSEINENVRVGKEEGEVVVRNVRFGNKKNVFFFSLGKEG
jgi:hypothetical protein